jgi:glycosyltransferase involved in cell wall biosynthesis
MLWKNSIARNADKVIVPSEYLREEAVINGVAANKISVLPLFTNKNPNNVYVKPEKNTILFVGRLDPLKGISEFLKSLSLIKRSTWKAYIIGMGEGMIKYIKMAEDLGIRDNIEFLKNLNYNDLDEYYKKASVVVFPSMSPESFGLVGIEAMSFGRPVVAFDSGGPRDWLVNNETGFLVKRAEVRELSDRISRLLGDESLAIDMGRNAMERVKQFYRKDAHLEKLLKIYKEAIDNRAL